MKADWLMLFKEIITLHYENYTKHINGHQQNTDVLNIKVLAHVVFIAFQSVKSLNILRLVQLWLRKNKSVFLEGFLQLHAYHKFKNIDAESFVSFSH
jgi:hypothetical protein